MQTDNATIAKVLAPQFVGTSENLIAESLKNYKANDTWMTTPSMTKASFDRLQDVMQNAGELDTRANFDNIVNNTIANKIAK